MDMIAANEIYLSYDEPLKASTQLISTCTFTNSRKICHSQKLASWIKKQKLGSAY